MKKSSHTFIVSLLFLTLQTLLLGQVTPTFQCASDEAMQSHPELLERQILLEKAILQKNKNGGLEKSATPPYTLPVVVHIIHNNGLGDIPDAQVFAAIEQLNQAFAHQGYYADQGDGHDTQIQFCLAKRDPDGNATNGITRTSSPLTNMDKDTDDQVLKDLSRWEPKDYINAWVVNAINSSSSGPGVVGYAYLASAHGEPFDGIVCEAAYFGTSPKDNSVLIHEMGHYLNLYHTFQGGCGNGDCLQNGDRVCDTPPDQVTFSTCGFNSCDTDTDDSSTNNPLTTDVVDKTENYMDYSPFECYHAFTAGQAERMYQAIEGPRSSLLNSLGCLSPCTIPINAVFTVASTSVLAGETIAFTNGTTGATSYEWRVAGNVFSNDVDPSYVFNDLGVFNIELTATNSDPNCIESTTVSFQVACPVNAEFTINTPILTVGETFSATNISQNATSYKWFINGVFINNNTDLNYTFSSPGFYTVVLEAFNGVCQDNHVLIVTVESDGPCADPYAGDYLVMEGEGYNNVYFGGILPDGSTYYHAWAGGQTSYAKFDPLGNLQWQRDYDQIYMSAAGDYDDGSILTQALEPDFFVHYLTKLDPDGNIQWVKNVENGQGGLRFGSTEHGAFVHTVTDGSYKFRMAFLGHDGEVISNRRYRTESLLNTFDDYDAYDITGKYVYLVGDGLKGDRGGMVFKLDTLGNVAFMKLYTHPDMEHMGLRAVRATPDGGFLAAGRADAAANDDIDVWLIKGDANGQVEWSRKIERVMGTINTEVATWLQMRPDGGCSINVWTLGPSRQSWLSFSANGELLYAREFTTASNETARAIGVAPIGEDVLAITTPLGSSNWALTTMDDEDGLGLSCLSHYDVPFTSADFPVNTTNIGFTIESNTINITDGSLIEKPVKRALIRQPFCVDSLDCPEICDNGLDDDEDGYVDCFDEDCECFNGTDCNGQVDSIRARLAWRSSMSYVSNSATPLVANLNPQTDSMPEIILMEWHAQPTAGFYVEKMMIYQGDGSNADAPDELITDGLFLGNTVPAIGDVNGDGNIEMVVVTDWPGWPNSSRLSVYNSYSPGSSPAMSFVTETNTRLIRASDRPALADFNGDGMAEVYVHNDVYQFDFSDPNAPTLTRVLNGGAHGGQFSSYSQPTAVDILSPADCNGDPDCNGLEIVAGGFIYSIDLDPLDGDGRQMKVQRDLNQMTSMAFKDGYTHTADVNLDGLLDVIVLASSFGDRGLYIWDKNGLVHYFRFTDPAWLATAATINDVYDDRLDGYAQNFPEILFSVGPKLICFNLNAAAANPNQPYWWAMDVTDESHVASPSTFDLNGDGLAEILFRDEIEFRIMYGGQAPFPAGVDSERNHYKTACASGTIDEHPVVADVDMDGEAEILTTGQLFCDPDNIDLSGQLWVFESDSTPWLPARSVWNQYNYNGVNINDDLTIPKQQQVHHLEFPGVGSGKRPLNFAHSQMPIFNENFDPYFPVPDAVVQLDSSQCETDSIQLWLTFCNQGSAALPNSLPIAFYQNDPTAVAATLLGTELTTTALPIDSCFSFPLKIPAVYNTPIFVLVNDNGTLPTPFDPTVDFPNTGVLECDYENNITQFNIPYQSPILDLGPDIATCNSSTNTLDAGSGFVKYGWQDGSIDPIFTAYEPGTYWVDAWDVCGFVHTDTVVISLDQTVAIELGPDVVICNGDSIGLSANGFSAVNWYPSAGLGCDDCPTTNASPNNTTTYYATGQFGGCFSTDSIRVTVAGSPDFMLEAVDGDCAMTASITAVPTAGSSLTYLWSNGETTSVTQPTQSGMYAVTATNQAGCSMADSVAIIITGGVAFSSQTLPILCYEDSTGAINIEPTQGAAPFLFTWSNGAATQNLANLPAGNYTLTITDANGCTATKNHFLNNPYELAIAPTLSHISCNNDPGVIALFPEGGVPPLAVLWSNGATAPEISVTSPGLYTATITDANGCTLVFEHDIDAEEALVVSIFLKQLQCHADMDGTAALSPINGTPPFSYIWENGSTDSLLTGLGNEAHSVTVTDALGCIKILSFNLEAPDPLGLSASSTPVKCFGEMNGQASVVADGGTPDYSYHWSNLAVTPIIENLPVGWYQVTVTDEHGCQDSTAVFVNAPSLLEVSASADPSELCPDETGDLTATAVGGTWPYSYSWNGAGADSFLLNAPAGNYAVEVTDTNGCMANETLVIGEISPPISIQNTIGAATGASSSDGAVTIADIMGGTPPFQFLWSNGDTTQSVNGLLPGMYSLTMTDAAGCSYTFEFEVSIMVGTGQVMQTGFEVSLFPNPVAENGDAVLFIKTNVFQKMEYKLFDVTGRALVENTLHPAVGLAQHPITAPDLAGVYFLQIIGENRQRAFVKWVVAGR